MAPGILDIYARELSGTKRKVFFSFHYADVMRVNNVRLSGEFKTKDHYNGRDVQGFYDKSLWESRKRDGEESLRSLIRTGVENSSVVCVLIGSQTWQRPWVRYEIARSVIDGKGLLGVHLNNINHHQSQGSHPLGENPMRYLGLYKSDNGNFYLAERVSINGSYTWKQYQKHQIAVSVPSYMTPPRTAVPVRLSDCVRIYDWASSGHSQIGNWIDTAAQAAGR
ncbi:TIR domain-containing protein [Lichenihabitans sp. Uapishka_5]|uniref:TIR domain-containing protein n=1 Tax=Lichenihabitans sp. Uapishka_5 TaxID=3037302 RepID=UPI0029E81AB2|nr:TIR domain-containing protein [Lichenihabitans sp. Uapishka_5]MDX7953720.1 TIR domain-containing protein [Lichenihabitans sp. Uapishka_5]